MKGKLIGAILGGLAAGPWGAALGLAAGHIFDSAASAVSGSATGGGTETGHIPLSLFSAISKLAKIDGQISEAEIDAIERIFKDLNFSSETRSQAIECFRRAKTDPHTFAEILPQLAADFTSPEARKAVFAVLKARSPSCGSGFVYDGSFSGKLTAGDGIFAGMLKKAGIAVFSEETLGTAEDFAVDPKAFEG